MNILSNNEIQCIISHCHSLQDAVSFASTSKSILRAIGCPPYSCAHCCSSLMSLENEYSYLDELANGLRQTNNDLVFEEDAISLLVRAADTYIIDYIVCTLPLAKSTRFSSDLLIIEDMRLVGQILRRMHNI